MDGPNGEDVDTSSDRFVQSYNSISMRSLVTIVLHSYDPKTFSDFLDTGSGGFYLNCTSTKNPQTSFRIERKEGKVLVRSYSAHAA